MAIQISYTSLCECTYTICNNLPRDLLTSRMLRATINWPDLPNLQSRGVTKTFIDLMNMTLNFKRMWDFKFCRFSSDKKTSSRTLRFMNSSSMGVFLADYKFNKRKNSFLYHPSSFVVNVYTSLIFTSTLTNNIIVKVQHWIGNT